MKKRDKDTIGIQIQPKDSDNYCVCLIISSMYRRDSVDISKIIRCQAIKNEIIIVVTNDRLIKIRSGIRQLAGLLKRYHFIRTHKTAIVNTIHVDRYQLEEHCLVMADGSNVPVVKWKRKRLLKSMEAISSN